jgi:CheY-like chemotaxis protein
MNLFLGPTRRFTLRKKQAGTGFLFMNEQKRSLIFEGEVLLCEDNRMNQELISDRLAKLGLKTIVAEDGKVGVELVASRVQNGIKPFALVFMDMYMPVMDGLEAAAEIGKLNTGTPIIAMTANSAPARREKYAAAGMSDWVNKPFTSKELLDCLMKYLKPAAQGASDFQSGDIRSAVFQSKDLRPTDFRSADIHSSPELSFLDKPHDTREDEKLKIKLIHFFMESNKNIYNEIIKAVEEGEIKTAHRFSHSLKSNAGMLGKTGLQKAAEDVEKLFLNEENVTLALKAHELTMSVLKAELDAVLEEFTPLVAETAISAMGEDAGTKSEPLNEEQIRVLLDELELMLDGGNTECLDLIDSIRLIPESGGQLSDVQSPEVLLLRRLIQQLSQQIEYFEFDNALKTLLRLKKECMGIDDE